MDKHIDNFYDFTRDSFKLENYKYAEFDAKIPVAI
jgi:thymidylate synthase